MDKRMGSEKEYYKVEQMVGLKAEMKVWIEVLKKVY